MDGNKKSKKKGAPYGNLNALKHGFYAKTFYLTEAKDLEEMISLNQTANLQSEISLLRITLRRLCELHPVEDQADVDTACRIISTIGVITTRISRLIRTNQYLGSGSPDVVYAISQAIKELKDKFPVLQELED